MGYLVGVAAARLGRLGGGRGGMASEEEEEVERRIYPS
eukprot:COSAG02_NODE_40276_length_407_cov_0.876623_1_plen_37_part_01